MIKNLCIAIKKNLLEKRIGMEVVVTESYGLQWIGKLKKVHNEYSEVSFSHIINAEYSHTYSQGEVVKIDNKLISIIKEPRG